MNTYKYTPEDAKLRNPSTCYENVSINHFADFTKYRRPTGKPADRPAGAILRSTGTLG